MREIYKIFENIEYEVLNESTEFEIQGIEFDSRKIKDNYIFVAMIGSIVDGHNYINTAIKNGAKMILIEKKCVEIDPKITYIYIENMRKKLGKIASNYYSWPQNKLKIIGITGTNGKTTSSYILENILERTSRIGTTGHRILDEEKETVNTTPESLDLIKLIDESVKKNVEYFIMEVSSHALEVGRVDALLFDCAMFTNLTQDHLDFHETMENYYCAKKKLFEKLRDINSTAVLNMDDESGKRIYTEKKDGIKNIITYSIKDDSADLYAKILEYNNFGMKIEISYKERQYQFNTKLVGEYNLQNILGCVGIALCNNIEIEHIVSKLETMESVPGRFEIIENNKDVRVVVDYAHTDDGLSNILSSIKEITKGKIITVFGAGGDRDKSKRPKMAKAAAKYSDIVVITSDNPRTENIRTIIRDIEKGLIDIAFEKDMYKIVENREEAIKYAISLCEKDDTLLIAGKGHETYQIIGTEKIHFDDREVARKYLK